MDLNSTLKTLEQELKLSSEQAREELQSIRTGKASPALIENLIITAYEGQSKLKLQELASITTNSPTTLVITPFDSSIVQDIERAILSSPLSLSCAVEGKMLRITIPPLSQEQRERFAKLVSQKVEEAKVHCRNARDNARKKLKQEFEAKRLTQDEKFKAEKDIDETTKKYVEQLEEMRRKKHSEIISL